MRHQDCMHLLKNDQFKNHKNHPELSKKMILKITFNFVPTPSVPMTNNRPGHSMALRSNNPPNNPSLGQHPGRAVAAARLLILSTKASPASMSTPESLYVSPTCEETFLD